MNPESVIARPVKGQSDWLSREAGGLQQLALVVVVLPIGAADRPRPSRERRARQHAFAGWRAGCDNRRRRR